MWELDRRGRWKIVSFVEVESLCDATVYPLRTPRLEDTVLDAHNREPTTIITQRYLSFLHFCRWSKLGHHKKSALFISKIRVERSHSILCTIVTKSTQLLYCSLVGLNASIQEKKMEFSMLNRHLMFSFVYWYNRQVL